MHYTSTVWPDWASFESFWRRILVQNYPNATFRAILRASILRNNCYGYFLGNLLETFGLPFISTSVSVTRFDEILPLWQKVTSRWQNFDCLFLFRQNAEPTLANLLHCWANFQCCKWPNIEKYSNHLVTLSVTRSTRMIWTRHRRVSQAWASPTYCIILPRICYELSAT